MKPEAYIWFCDCGWHQEYKNDITVYKCPMCKGANNLGTMAGTNECMDEFIRGFDAGQKEKAEYLSKFKQYKR